MVGVVVDPGFPPLELTVGHEQALLAQVEDAAAGVVRHPPQLPGANDAAPAQTNQSAAAFIHLVQEGEDVQLALHRQQVEGKVILRRFPPAAYGHQGSFPWRHDDRGRNEAGGHWWRSESPPGGLVIRFSHKYPWSGEVWKIRGTENTLLSPHLTGRKHNIQSASLCGVIYVPSGEDRVILEFT